ncbi:MAG: glutathione S-transferase [Phenylobacterium sp.]|nr:glutathione S-transferase [Phenylobacterium sp.]
MLVLHGHPLSTFCMKVTMALYETGTPFEDKLLDLGDGAARERFFALWPLGQMPVLRDEARGETVPETSAILEYLSLYYPGKVALVPKAPDLAWRARLAERIFDLHVQVPMQKIVGDRNRPAGSKDPFGVNGARAQLARSLDFVDGQMAERAWALGETFCIADCAAAPALFYADKVLPFAATHPNAFAYFQRLKARPSFARSLKDAEPFFHMFPADA